MWPAKPKELPTPVLKCLKGLKKRLMGKRYFDVSQVFRTLVVSGVDEVEEVFIAFLARLGGRRHLDDPEVDPVKAVKLGHFTIKYFFDISNKHENLTVKIGK